MDQVKDIGQRTIADFGDQWTRFRDNEGYYASLAMLQDHLGPLFTAEELGGMTVGDIGSGTGRIVQMLAAAGAAKIHAFEPSNAYGVLRENVRHLGAAIECHQLAGDAIPQSLQLDAIVSIGVIHHIPNPAPVLSAAFKALRPGGRIFLWLYGVEGNERYLRMILPLRRITTRLPHRVLVWLCHILNRVADIYIAMGRFVPLPMRDYLVNVFSRFSRKTRMLVIYDQLNPAFAKYYSEGEARSLLADHGFEHIGLYHRHGYSWSVTGVRPG